MLSVDVEKRLGDFFLCGALRDRRWCYRLVRRFVSIHKAAGGEGGVSV